MGEDKISDIFVFVEKRYYIAKTNQHSGIHV